MDFTEVSNSLKLKELHRDRDYNGLLELALLLNHQSSFNYRGMKVFMNQLLTREAEFMFERKKVARFDDEPCDLW
jgi:hypothetical protein